MSARISLPRQQIHLLPSYTNPHSPLLLRTALSKLIRKSPMIPPDAPPDRCTSHGTSYDVPSTIFCRLMYQLSQQMTRWHSKLTTMFSAVLLSLVRSLLMKRGKLVASSHRMSLSILVSRCEGRQRLFKNGGVIDPFAICYVCKWISGRDFSVHNRVILLTLHTGLCSATCLGQDRNKSISFVQVKCEGLYLRLFMGGLH